MKTKFLMLAIATGLFLNSCTSSDDTTSAPATVTGEITGDITTNKAYPKGNYTLKGIVKIQSGATLTFVAGTTITADVTSGTDALVVLNGGKLEMIGTAAEPIICTEISKVSGTWGGIIMYGNAPIVGAAGVTRANAEDGLVNSLTLTSYTYGGNDEAHNGGTLKYVRVEYAGKKLGDGTSEMNGFSFYSVGSGTILENLVSYKGADDGFEFYGGTVNLKNAISYGNSDDSFDWQDGWKGQENTNWFAYQIGIGNFGLEVEAKSVNNTFFPKVSNITLKRAAGTVTEGGTSAAEFDAIQFKKQGNGEYSNVVISGYTAPTAVAVRIQDAPTNTDQVNGNKIKMFNINIAGSTPQSGGTAAFIVVFPVANFTTNTTAIGASLNPGAWATVDGVNLLANLQ